MRKIYGNILKTYFTRQLCQRRMLLRVTQAEMAERLLMDDRSYIDLEHGKSGCGATTLAVYMVYVCDDVYGFVEGLRRAFEAGNDSVA